MNLHSIHPSQPIGKVVTNALTVQRRAWNFGHENYGASIDVLAEMKVVLSKFKYLNPKQKELAETLSRYPEIKYAKRMGSAARNTVHQFVVTLK